MTTGQVAKEERTGARGEGEGRPRRQCEANFGCARSARRKGSVKFALARGNRAAFSTEICSARCAFHPLVRERATIPDRPTDAADSSLLVCKTPHRLHVRNIDTAYVGCVGNHNVSIEHCSRNHEAATEPALSCTANGFFACVTTALQLSLSWMHTSYWPHAPHTGGRFFCVHAYSTALSLIAV